MLPLRSLWKAKQAKQLARTLSAEIKHPAVAPLIDVDSAHGCHYLVWPHIEGERLSDRVGSSGSLPPGEAAALLGHLASALAACHTCGAVHGALTPHSVAFGSNELPLLLELGAGALLAQSIAEDESLFDSMSTALTSAGVLAFAAPELAVGSDDPAPAVDQYALGAVGYFAVTGLPPYPHPTLAEQLRAKRRPPAIGRNRQPRGVGRAGGGDRADDGSRPERPVRGAGRGRGAVRGAGRVGTGGGIGRRATTQNRLADVVQDRRVPPFGRGRFLGRTRFWR